MLRKGGGRGEGEGEGGEEERRRGEERRGGHSMLRAIGEVHA